MESQLQELKTRLAEINDLHAAVAVLVWDEQVYMPPGGAVARGRQIATLGRIAHEKFIDPAIGRLLEDLRPYEESLPPESDDASLIRVTRRDYEKTVNVPPAFVAELYAHGSASFQAWTKARPADDFAMMVPYLDRTVELNRRFAEYFPGYDHIADPLIDLSDYGMKASTVRDLFAQLRAELAPIMQAIAGQPIADDTCLRQHYPEAQQIAFGEQVIRRLGYDFERGRQDKTHHPFMTKFSLGDVRITTRLKEDDLTEGLFSTIHEAGHALYEQGIRMDFEGTPLAQGTSAGVHESQSRLWENIVGRSRGFWQFFYPQLQAAFPDQLRRVPLDTFYRAINKVQRSLIRVDADEVTYNLHVMLRFELELELLEGRLAARDLAEAWNARYSADLGIAPPDDRDGVLQDVHWFGGMVGGAFQGYTLGNIMSAQLFDAAVHARPAIPQEIESGEFGALHGWLKENVYQHGRKFTAPEVIERASGCPLTMEPYITYLRRKFGELYGL